MEQNKKRAKEEKIKRMEKKHKNVFLVQTQLLRSKIRQRVYKFYEREFITKILNENNIYI